MDKLEILKKWIYESSRIVFFGGAGVSTEVCILVHHIGLIYSWNFIPVTVVPST